MMMHKSSHFDKSISYIMSYIISKYSPSLESRSISPSSVIICYYLYKSGRIVDMYIELKLFSLAYYSEGF